MRASEQETVNGRAVLYTGSNRSAKRDQSLSVQELKHVYTDSLTSPYVFKVSHEYFKDYLQQVVSFSHVSSFSSLARLAQDEGWEFSPHYLAFEEIKPCFTEFVAALEPRYSTMKLIRQRYDRAVRFVEDANASSDTVDSHSQLVSQRYGQLQGAEAEFMQGLSDGWDACIRHFYQQVAWPDAWCEWRQSSAGCLKSCFEQSTWWDNELNDWFFKPLLILHQMQHFMGLFSQRAGVSLDWDGCGKILTVSDQSSPPHIFLEGYHSQVEVELPLFHATRDALLNHMRSQVGNSDVSLPRQFHFYDDKYADIVYGFFKTRQHLIPEGLVLVTHRYNYYDVVEGRFVDGFPVNPITTCAEPLVGTGELWPCARPGQRSCNDGLMAGVNTVFTLPGSCAPPSIELQGAPTCPLF